MTDDINYRIKQWKPPARPEWVRRMNEEGAFLDLKSVVPLDENSLIERAKANTGLSDFGSSDWYEPFKIFIKALDEESELNLMGRLMTRSDILMNLEARLRVEDTYKRHPEIADQQLSPVIMIVGSGRSGTSAIQNLLSLDPDHGTPKSWESLFPCPPPEAATYRTDPRIAIAHGRVDQWNRVTPEIMSMHEFGGDMPTELIQVETLAFQNGAWLDLYGLVPSFDAHLTNSNFIASITYAKRVLKLLQWKNPRKRWLLKSPDTMRYMPGLFQVFPDTQLVWMHRDPIKCVSSMVSLVGTLFWIRSDKPLNEQAIAQLTNPAGLAGLFGMVMDQIEQGLVPKERLRSVQYLDFVADPLKTVQKLYRDMGIQMTDRAKAAMEKYVHENPRESRPAHKYSTGDAARQKEERKLFARYQTLFGVQSEA
jgi:hypothetical protein